MFRFIVAVVFVLLAVYSWHFDDNLKEKYRDQNGVRPAAVSPAK